MKYFAELAFGVTAKIMFAFGVTAKGTAAADGRRGYFRKKIGIPETRNPDNTIARSTAELMFAFGVTAAPAEGAAANLQAR